MDFGLILTIFLIGFVGSFVSGMLGIGGAIINYPLLLFLPPYLGFDSFSSYEVSGIVAIQVLVATFSGFLGYRKSEYLDRSLLIYMGTSILLGSLIGSFTSHLLMEETINVVYGILATTALIMMFIPTQQSDISNQVDSRKWLATFLTFFIGIGAGTVGAGGAFLLIPVMLLVLRISMRTAIATSMAVTFIASIGTSIGKLSTGQVPIFVTMIIVIASFIAAQIGVITGKRMNTKVLRIALGLLITGAVFKSWVDILL